MTGIKDTIENKIVNEPGELISKLIEAGFCYVAFIILAMYGGTVNYIAKVKKRKNKIFSFTELMGEWAISGFSGLLTSFVCTELGMSWQMTAFFTGVAGHLGGAAIKMFESYFRKHFPTVDKED